MNESKTVIAVEPKPPKSAKVVDPDILALREKHKANVAELKRGRKSCAILATIVEKFLPQMADSDIEKLLTAIGPKPVTAPLPPRPTPAVVAMEGQPRPAMPRPAQPMPGPVSPRKP
jgi:hypothetical protein